MDHSAGAPWGERWTDRLGHHAGEILIAAIVSVVALRLHPPGIALAMTMSVTLFTIVLLAWLLMRQHDRRLCERCAGAMPLNPAEQAARYRRRFWTVHTAAEPRFLIPYLVVLIGSNFATTSAGQIGWAIVQLSMVYLILSHTSHRRLQPWCPWCRGGGDEVGEHPEVLPRDDRQLT